MSNITIECAPIGQKRLVFGAELQRNCQFSRRPCTEAANDARNRALRLLMSLEGTEVSAFFKG